MAGGGVGRLKFDSGHSSDSKSGGYPLSTVFLFCLFDGPANASLDVFKRSPVAGSAPGVGQLSVRAAPLQMAVISALYDPALLLIVGNEPS